MDFEELLTRYTNELNISNARLISNRILERENVNKRIKNDHDEILIDRQRKKVHEQSENLDKLNQELYETKESKSETEK
jgi:hypothetical protein